MSKRAVNGLRRPTTVFQSRRREGWMFRHERELEEHRAALDKLQLRMGSVCGPQESPVRTPSKSGGSCK